MSYILEALKRADLERTRGATPDIHAATWPAIGDEPAPRPGPWLWLLGLLVVGALALLIWRVASAPAEPTAGASPPPAAPRSGEIVPSAAQLPPAAPPHVGVLPATPFLPKPKRLLPNAPAAEPEPAAVAAAGELATVKPAAPVDNRSDGKVVARQDLPAEVRQQLPALKLGGLVYSKQAAQRLLIVDGQVLREGESAGAGVVLEQIQPRSAVFRFMQHRFEQSL